LSSYETVATLHAGQASHVEISPSATIGKVEKSVTNLKNQQWGSVENEQILAWPSSILTVVHSLLLCCGPISKRERKIKTKYSSCTGSRKWKERAATSSSISITNDTIQWIVQINMTLLI
jgi:hypothetical protein